MIRTHKARLSLAAALSTGVLLAVVFVLIVYAAERTALVRKEGEMRSAIRALIGDPEGLEVSEFDESHPDMSFTVYSQGGQVVLQHGRLRLQKHLGFQQSGNIVSIGAKRGTQIVVEGADWSETAKGIDRLALVLGILWLPLTLMVGAVTWFTARSVFQPLEKLAEQATSIEGANLTQRLTTSDRAEFGLFAQQLNRMLDRIEATVQREDQFAGDAAHELRTPLAILRTRIETTLLRDRSKSEYVESFGALLTEVDRLTRIVEALLRTAKKSPSHVLPIDAEPIVQDTATRWQESYIAQDVFLSTETRPATVKIAAEELVVVIDNLLDNALRFSQPGSTVWLSLEVKRDSVEFTVRDEGPGIPNELGSRVFDRFVRSDESRNRASGGAGIGLAVCKKILLSRGGDITLQVTDMPGAEIMFWLPLIPPTEME